VSRGHSVIESLGVYLPPTVMTTEEVAQGCRQRLVFPLERMAGIRSHRTGADVDFSIDLAAKAAERCLEKSRYAPEQVDLVVCGHTARFDGPGNRFSFEPATAVKLKRRLGLTNALAFDVSNACAGTFTAIGIIDTFIQLGLVRCGLALSGEYLTPLMRTAQKETTQYLDPRMACLTIGDAGAAVMLEAASGDGTGLYGLEMYTLGRYAPECVGKVTDQPHGGYIMITDAVKLAPVTVRAGVGHAAHVFSKQGWPLDGFRYLIVHQTSRLSIRDAASEINRAFNRRVCTDGNMVNNLLDRGNTGSTTHWVALADYIQDRRIDSGDKVVFGITASGLTIGTALYTFDDLPERMRGDKPSKPAPNGHPRAAEAPELPRVRIESVGTLAEDMAPRGAVESARLAGEDCLSRSAHTRKEVGLLIHAGVYRDDFLVEPAMAALVAGALDLNGTAEAHESAKTLAFDLLNGSLGFLNACHVGVQMVRGGRHRTVMVVASEIENNTTTFPERLLGLRPAGSAVVLDRGPDGAVGFGRFLFRSFTEHLDAWETHVAHEDGKSYLQVARDPRLEELYLEAIRCTVAELLAFEGLEARALDLVLPPQISPRFVVRLAADLGLAREKVVDVAQEGGDLFTSSLAYGLAQAQRDGRAAPGRLGLLIGAGAGIQVGCALYHF
jgi:3-oxoacyl-[acyl-carrier-protein] synthase III